MKRCIAMIAMILGFWSQDINAACFLDCLLQPGTVCINGICVNIVPTPTPTPIPVKKSEVRLEMMPRDLIVPVIVDCVGMDMTKFQVILLRKSPPPIAYYFSDIYCLSHTNTNTFFARKDILNRYVFILSEPNEPIVWHFHGTDFIFNEWINPVFNDFFKTKTCSELKNSGFYFNSGISFKGDLSDFEGVTFTFK